MKRAAFLIALGSLALSSGPLRIAAAAAPGMQVSCVASPGVVKATKAPKGTVKVLFDWTDNAAGYIGQTQGVRTSGSWTSPTPYNAASVSAAAYDKNNTVLATGSASCN